jgi:predicted NUDIX family phosphoesterase
VTEQVAADQTRLEEYRAIPRVLATPQEDVLCVLSETYQSSLTFQGIDTSPKALLATLLSGNTTHISRSDVEDVNYAKQFVTYVIVQCGHHVLSFERSHLSRAAEFLRGSKCIGFGGHVSAADLTIFSEFDHGLSECARREVSEELSVYRTRADVKSRSSTQNLTQKLVRESPLELIGVLNDDSSEVGRRHVAVVYRLWISNWDDARRLRKGESSIRSLEWIDLTDDTIDLNKYEYWSQLCLRKFYPSASLSHSGLEIVNPTKLSRAPVLVIAGRVGSGKSATARYLATTLSVPIVNSGQVLGEIMKAGPLSEIGRENFQAAALNFITKPVGPRRLAKALATEVRRLGGKAIIDGIRHLETYHMLVD